MTVTDADYLATFECASCGAQFITSVAEFRDRPYPIPACSDICNILAATNKENQ